MNITELIVEFIQEGNVVEIPGIGTLTGTNVSAHHDAANGTYYPSRRTVALNDSVSGNKAVVRRIAEKECVTNDIAEQMWTNFVGALDDKLQRSPAGHEFPGLGTLRRVNGKACFEALEGLDLDAGKRREQPIEHVTTYTPKAVADPFAAFDKPAEEPKSAAPAEEPAPAPAPEPQPAPESEPQPAEAPAEPAAEPEHHHRHEIGNVIIATSSTATAAELSELKKQLDRLPSSQMDAKTQRRMEKERSRAEKEARKAEEKARKEAERAEKEARKAAECAAKHQQRSAEEAEKELSLAKKQEQADELKIQKEVERDRKRAEKAAIAEAHRALKEAKRQSKRQARQDRQEESDPRAADRKRIRRMVIILAILLVVLFGGYKGYRYWRTYVPETKGINNAKHVELPYFSRFSRDLAALEYDQDMIDYNREMVDAFMTDYIREYLGARHYSNAFTVVMDRIDEYAGERLQELMGEPQYAVQRFFPFNDYFRDYCYKELQGVGGYVNRCRVQGELMDAERLDNFLDALISELGLHPDGTRGMMGGNGNAGTGNGTNAKANTNAAEYVEVVPSAPTLKASKQGFDIIAGFCTQKSKADKMTNQLKSLGCDAYIINRSGLYYVSMGSAGSRTAAEALYNYIKSWYKGDITIKNWNE